MRLAQIKLISLVGLGGMLEFYDFTIYALFASYISHAFFPHANPVVSLVNAYMVFAVGYLGRPLGSVIFGHFGDKYGRKHAFTFAAFLMAFSTFCIGCLPTYEQIGWLAPTLLTLCRMLQGISLGGEIGGITVFVTEHAEEHERGFVAGLIFMAITFGNVLGGLLGYTLTHFLPEEVLYAWGFRIPFCIGFILGIIAYYIRKKTLETPEFMQLATRQKARIPFLHLIRFAFPQLLLSISLTAVCATTFALLMYLPSYLTTILHYPVTSSYFYNFIGFFILSIFTAVFGYISDYVGRKQLIIFGSILVLLSAPYLFQALIFHHNLLLFNVGIAFLTAIVNGCFGCAIVEQFETNIRYTGTAVAYNAGIALFTGVTPFASTALFKLTHNVAAPVYFLLICALITLAGAIFMRSKPTENKLALESV